MLEENGEEQMDGETGKQGGSGISCGVELFDIITKKKAYCFRQMLSRKYLMPDAMEVKIEDLKGVGRRRM